MIFIRVSLIFDWLAMKLIKCDLCGKTIKRPDMLMYSSSECINEANRLELLAVDDDGCMSTKLSFDLCEDCGKRLYTELKTLKKKFSRKILDYDSSNYRKEYDESTNKPDA